VYDYNEAYTRRCFKISWGLYFYLGCYITICVYYVGFNNEFRPMHVCVYLRQTDRQAYDTKQEQTSKNSITRGV